MTTSEDTPVTKTDLSPALPAGWGPLQSSLPLMPGVTYLRCRNHGGYQLTPDANSLIPEPLRRPGGLYEHDVDAAIPAWYLGFVGADRDAARAVMLHNFGHDPEADH